MPIGDGAKHGARGGTVRRAVVLHPPGTDLPPVLARALHTRGIETVATSEPMLAMAHLCAPGSSVRAVLLVDPRACLGAGELVGAVSRFRPATACWVYEGTPGEPLRSVRGDDAARWVEQPTPEPVQAPKSAQPARSPNPPKPAPELRLTGDAEGEIPPYFGDHSAPDPEHGPASGRTILTDEELAMLLADDEGLSGGR